MLISKNDPHHGAVILRTPYPLHDEKKLRRFSALLVTFRGLHSQKYAFLLLLVILKNDQLIERYNPVPSVFLLNKIFFLRFVTVRGSRGP